LAWLRFHPNASTVTFNHLPAKSQSNAGAWNSISVQTPEHVEYPRRVSVIDADAIVAH